MISELPPSVVVLGGAGAVLLVVFARTLLEAGERAAGGALMAWLLVGILTLGFVSAGYPLLAGSGETWSLAAVMLSFGSIIGLSFSEAVKNILKEIDVRKLLLIQAGINIKLVLFHPAICKGAPVSDEFAVIGGCGAVAASVLAVLTTVAAFYRVLLWRAYVLLWCLVGLIHLLAMVVPSVVDSLSVTGSLAMDAAATSMSALIGISVYMITIQAVRLQGLLFTEDDNLSLASPKRWYSL